MHKWQSNRSRGVWVIAALVIAGVLAGGTALAGYKYAYSTVTVAKSYDGSGYAYGHLSGARDSADTMQQLGCSVTNRTTSGFTASCRATDVNGLTGVCTTTSTTMAMPINSASADAAFYITWDGAGKCTEISIYNYSYYPTKAH